MHSRPAYPSDLSDARWALIEPVLSAWRAARARAGLGLAEPVHDLREIVNAISYVNRAGCAWQMLPHDFPPYKTVYDYYAKWEKDGTAEVIHDLLRRQVREWAGRTPGPSAALVDAQSVKTSGSVPESGQGIDAAKKIKGRKRHIATDTLGLLLVVLVTAASVQDTPDGGPWWTSWPPATPRSPRSGWTPDTTAASPRPVPRTASISRSSANHPATRASSHCHGGGQSSAPTAG